jgi:hypothetical protein
MIPVVVNYQLSSTVGTTSLSLASSSAGISTILQLNGTFGTSSPFGPGVLATTGIQQRITITSGSSDTGIYYHIVGLNAAGFTVQEYLVGGAAGSTVQSNLDYRTIISIQPSASSVAQSLATTASTVSAGTNGVGSSLWNIVNWHNTPSNISYATVLRSGAATWTIQYTYDDPNKLPVGVAYPQPFSHPTIVNATTSIDGFSNDPLTAWRLYISAGTGLVSATGIQAGIAGA